jgi:hypothetical protein
MDIGEVKRVVKVQPEPVRVTPVAPVEPNPQPEPVMVPA